jgi:hypothetical protein
MLPFESEMSTFGPQLVVLFWGGGGNFQRWDLAGESRSLGAGPWGEMEYCRWPFPVSLSFSCLP